MAKNGDNQGNEHVPVDPPVRDIYVDVFRICEDVRTSVEWLVLFKRAGADVYDGHPTRLEAWIV